MFDLKGAPLQYDAWPIARALRGERFANYELRCRRLDKRTEFVGSYSGTPVPHPDGRIALAVIAVRDVTEEKLAEQTLAESEARFRTMADGLPLIVWVHGADGQQQFVNRTVCEFFGVSEAETRGGRWQVLMHPDDATGYMNEFLACVRERQPFHAETRVRRADGQWRWIESWARPRFSASGEFLGFVGTSADITDRRRVEEALRHAKEEAERTSEAKSEFLATLSHELRTPLTPVLLTASIIESHPGLPDDLREDVASIRRNVELESRQISDLLDLTRIEKGKLHLDQQEVDLHLVIRSAIDICQREASATMTVELGASRHVVRGDATRLQQVFWNLINNAIKFTGSDGSIRCAQPTPTPAISPWRLSTPAPALIRRCCRRSSTLSNRARVRRRRSAAD